MITKQEIVEKAIQKAIDGGWTNRPDIGLQSADWLDPQNQVYIPYIIFNHDFAKALWGEGMLDSLQQMVIADDPVEYLGEHLG